MCHAATQKAVIHLAERPDADAEALAAILGHRLDLVVADDGCAFRLKMCRRLLRLARSSKAVFTHASRLCTKPSSALRKTSDQGIAMTARNFVRSKDDASRNHVCVVDGGHPSLLASGNSEVFFCSLGLPDGQRMPSCRPPSRLESEGVDKSRNSVLVSRMRTHAKKNGC